MRRDSNWISQKLAYLRLTVAALNSLASRVQNIKASLLSVKKKSAQTEKRLENPLFSKESRKKNTRGFQKLRFEKCDDNTPLENPKDPKIKNKNKINGETIFFRAFAFE